MSFDLECQRRQSFCKQGMNITDLHCQDLIWAADIFLQGFLQIIFAESWQLGQERGRERLKSTNLDLHLQQCCRDASPLAKGLLFFKYAYGQHFFILSIVNPMYLFYTEMVSLLLYMSVTEWLTKVRVVLKDSEICVFGKFLSINWSKINNHELIFFCI